MIIYEGKYGWDGKKSNNRFPVSWWPCSYDLKIVDLRDFFSGTLMMKPYLCIYSNTGEGFSISSNPEKFAKRICEEFFLDIDKVIWVDSGNKKTDFLEVITFNKRGSMGDMNFYSFTRRPPITGERQIIEKLGYSGV